MSFIQSIPLVHASTEETHPHQHEHGQILLVEKGILSLTIDHEQWTVAQGCLGWIPPGHTHEATMYGDMTGQLMYIDPSLTHEMPAFPKVGRYDCFQQGLVYRLIQLQTQASIAQHYLNVLIHEINTLQDFKWSFALPQDHRALKIALKLMQTPDDKRDQQAWAELGHISIRTMTRLFKTETGLSFSMWKQIIRLHAALRYLSDGETVSNTAMACGYDNVSFFIKIFKEKFGCTPSYFSGINRLIE